MHKSIEIERPLHLVNGQKSEHYKSFRGFQRNRCSSPALAFIETIPEGIFRLNFQIWPFHLEVYSDFLPCLKMHPRSGSAQLTNQIREVGAFYALFRARSLRRGKCNNEHEFVKIRLYLPTYMAGSFTNFFVAFPVSVACDVGAASLSQHNKTPFNHIFDVTVV